MNFKNCSQAIRTSKNKINTARNINFIAAFILFNFFHVTMALLLPSKYCCSILGNLTG